MNDITTPVFWDQRYKEEKTPWDLHGVPEALHHFLKTADKPGRVLIPGCGFGYEIAAFLNAGWDAWGLDFSKTVVQKAQSLLGKQTDRVIVGDFFTHHFAERFDVIYDRSFLCALLPSLRPLYEARIKELLLPKGKLLGLFFYHSEFEASLPEPEVSPYFLTTVEAKNLFSDFYLIEDKAVDDSLPWAKGRERWQQWKISSLEKILSTKEI